MSKPVLVDSISHKSTRIKYEPGKAVAPTGRNCSVIMQEFQHLAAEYPVLMTKNPDTGRFACVALFGFDEDENLFVEHGLWQTTYLPLNVQRQPFMIGTQETPSGESEYVVLLDEDDQRVQTSEGEPLFNERGFPTPFMEKITSILKTLKDGFELTGGFIERLLELDLISPATFKIEFDNGEQRQIRGLYTINQERLRALDGNTVIEMHQCGYLEPAYMMLASLGQIQKLIDRKNSRLKPTGG